MNEEINFEPGDLVAVFGGEIGKEGSFADKVSICRVMVTGESDLIVEDSYVSAYSRPSHYIVSKNICYKLYMPPENLSKIKPIEPQVGDLVLSYKKEPFKDDPPVEKTGIVYKISYKMGKPNMSTIICGTELVEVDYSSLIVLQRN